MVTRPLLTSTMRSSTASKEAGSPSPSTSPIENGWMVVDLKLKPTKADYRELKAALATFEECTSLSANTKRRKTAVGTFVPTGDVPCIKFSPPKVELPELPPTPVFVAKLDSSTQLYELLTRVFLPVWFLLLEFAGLVLEAWQEFDLTCFFPSENKSAREVLAGRWSACCAYYRTIGSIAIGNRKDNDMEVRALRHAFCPADEDSEGEGWLGSWLGDAWRGWGVGEERCEDCARRRRGVEGVGVGYVVWKEGGEDEGCGMDELSS